MVGGGTNLVYTPDTLNAAVGDMVIFTFMSTNHTATQSAFTTPCEALTGGMDSGFMPNVNNSVTPPPQMAMQVTVATPLCKFCLLSVQYPASNNSQGSTASKRVTVERE